MEADTNSVKHILSIYKTRLSMLENGIINPSPEMKEVVYTIVAKLSEMHPDKKLILDNSKILDAEGNLIVEFPAHII